MQQIARVPRGIFQGTNFMTPYPLAFYKGTFAGVTVYVELSEGTGMSNQPIFGVTVRRPNGEKATPDPSRLFQSRATAEAYIRNGCRDEEG